MASKKINWRVKSITLAKAIARETGYCEWCGRTKPEVQLQGAHILPEEYWQTAADPRNIICLCASCHKWNKNSWHKNPIRASAWFNSLYPGKYEELMSIATEKEKIDWEETYKDLFNQKDSR